MQVVTNRDNRIFIVKSNEEIGPIKVALEDINDDGDVTFRGFLPDAQLLLSPGISVILKDARIEGTLFRATILKVESKSAYHCSMLAGDDVAAIELIINALCDIEFCTFFEPIVYKAED